MPSYDDQIGAEEISSMMSQSSVQMQRVAESLDRMNEKAGRMAELFSQMRDYTQSEVKEMAAYRSEINTVADSYKTMHGNALKGMSDYSVALKALEDQVKNSAAAERKAIEQNKALRDKHQRIEMFTEGRMGKKKKAALQEELGTRESTAKKLRRMADDELSLIDKKVKRNKEIISDSKKLKVSSEQQLKVQQELFKTGEKKAHQEGRRRSQTDLLEIASDLHLPGVSHAATVAKYARRGMGDEDDGRSRMGRFMGGMGGVARGLGIAAGGYTAVQGYRVFNAAEQMAPMARTLQGQVGAGAAGLRQRSVEAYGGYGGIENLQTQIQLNRAVGGAAGAGQLRGVTDIANRYGLDRQEVVGQAGAAFGAGMTPGTATQDLERIMSEGVKAGMDRARITQFTQEVLGVQQELFRATGENNAQAIAEAMSQLMRASGQGEQFMRGPASQAVKGLDAAVKSAGRGQLGGQAAGTLFRAFGFGAGAEGGSNTQGYLDARRQMEGGLFGGGTGADALGNINKIFDQYLKESGGKKDVATLRMSDELGIGINQVEQLDEIRGRAAKGAITEDDIKKLQDMQNEAKDPMIRIAEINAEMSANIARTAGSVEGIASVVKINEGILKAQQSAVGLLSSIAKVLTGQGGADAGDMLSTIGSVASIAGMIAPSTTGKIAGKGGGALLKGGKSAGGALAKGAGALATMGGGGALGMATTLGGVGLAGAAGYGVGMGADYLADQFTTEENQFGQKSNIFERGIGKAMTFLPKSIGGISDEEYSDMYGTVPAGGAPRVDEVGQGQGAAPRKIEVVDKENTAVTAKNTQAIEKLTDAMMKGGSKAPNSNRTQIPRVGGSFR